MFRLSLVLLLLLAAPLSARPDAPALTEVEALRIENLRLEGIVIQHELQAWQAKRAKLKADLEAVRPGYTFDPETATFAPVPKDKKERP